MSRALQETCQFKLILYSSSHSVSNCLVTLKKATNTTKLIFLYRVHVYTEGCNTKCMPCKIETKGRTTATKTCKSITTQWAITLRQARISAVMDFAQKAYINVSMHSHEGDLLNAFSTWDIYCVYCRYSVEEGAENHKGHEDMSWQVFLSDVKCGRSDGPPPREEKKGQSPRRSRRTTAQQRVTHNLRRRPGGPPLSLETLNHSKTPGGPPPGTQKPNL